MNATVLTDLTISNGWACADMDQHRNSAQGAPSCAGLGKRLAKPRRQAIDMAAVRRGKSTESMSARSATLALALVATKTPYSTASTGSPRASLPAASLLLTKPCVAQKGKA